MARFVFLLLGSIQNGGKWGRIRLNVILLIIFLKYSLRQEGKRVRRAVKMISGHFLTFILHYVIELTEELRPSQQIDFQDRKESMVTSGTHGVWWGKNICK